MGIYSGRKDIYMVKKKHFLKFLQKNEGVFSVGIDAEHAIGTGRDRKLSGNNLVKYVKENYIYPYLRNNIGVFVVFSGKQIKYKEDVIGRRANDKLKWKKNAYTYVH